MKVKFIKEKIGYSVIMDELGIYTQGDTFEEALANLQSAILGLKEIDERYSLNVNSKLLSMSNMKEFTVECLEKQKKWVI